MRVLDICLTEAGPSRTGRWCISGRKADPPVRGSNWNSWLTSRLPHLFVTKVRSSINIYLGCITSLLNILTAVSDRVQHNLDNPPHLAA